MLQLNDDNYYTAEANKAYWSSSLFKTFERCPAKALAEISGEYERETSTSLLVGSYVDAYFTGDKGALGRFALEHPEIFKKDGSLKSDFRHAETMISAVKAQPLMMNYLKGDHQTIMTANLFDVDWKIKMDVFDGKRIVDLKTTKDFGEIYEPGFGYRNWLEYWQIDIQGAIYQKVVEQVTGQKLPFYIVAVTKEKVPDVAVIHLPQHILDTALKVVEAKIDGFDLMKKGLIPAERCEVCDWCKQSKRLVEPEEFEIEEA